MNPTTMFLRGYIAAVVCDKELPLKVVERTLNEVTGEITLTLASGLRLLITVVEVPCPRSIA